MSDPAGPRSIAVFCGARTGLDPAYAEAARSVGGLLGRRGLGLVFGGGRVGLMGVVADAALHAGAPVVGVIPRSMVDRELAHTGCTELHVIETMHERKAMMAERASAFLALPGGVGTLDEVFEAITWNQLAIHDKAIGFLDTDGFYQGLRTWLEHAADKGLVPQSTMDRLVFEADPEAMLDRLTGVADLRVQR
jgi:uncharacterized protein (TIGR00730 family)